MRDLLVKELPRLSSKGHAKLNLDKLRENPKEYSFPRNEKEHMQNMITSCTNAILKISAEKSENLNDKNYMTREGKVRLLCSVLHDIVLPLCRATQNYLS